MGLPPLILFSPFFFFFSPLQQVHEITTLSVADMGPPLPMGLLLPLTHLKSLNLSGNHMDNVSLFILTPISTLQVGGKDGEDGNLIASH